MKMWYENSKQVNRAYYPFGDWLSYHGFDKITKYFYVNCTYLNTLTQRNYALVDKSCLYYI